MSSSGRSASGPAVAQGSSPDIATPGDDAPGEEEPHDVPRKARLTSERAAAWAFGAYIVIAGPLLLHLGSFFWFFRDDWYFITDRELSSAHDLFAPHNSHWVTLPLVVFRLLWAVFGVRTYVPYQMVVIGAHLGVVVALRVVMRRAGVGPWIATIFAGSLVLFGPGREDIIWAFQMGFTGAVLLGMGQILLADHTGPLNRHDVMGLGLGILALTSTATGVAMAVIVGLAVFLRRGVKAAAFHTVPLAAVYGAWAVFAHPTTSTAFGRPTVRVVFDWVRSGQIGTFMSLGHYELVAWALFFMLIIGLAIAVIAPDGDGEGRAALVRRIRTIGIPLALFAGSFVFMALTAQARWFQGPKGARASRYLYLGAALTLPAMAVAAEALARRARSARPLVVGVVALLIAAAIPVNARSFDDPPFGRAYHRQRRELLTSAVRVPYARQVDPSVRPVADPFLSPGLNMGFLLFAYDHGKLRASTGDISPALKNELNVRLGLAQRPPTGYPTSCLMLGANDDLKLPRGAQFVWNGKFALHVRPIRDGKPGGNWVTLEPRDGNLVTVARPNTSFDWEPATPTPGAQLCQIR